jgi:hypothetical protein
MKEIHEINETLCKIRSGKLLDCEAGLELIESFGIG